ncbi:hypothetical protein E0L36_14330 [Streptomyces sp. AJS327]|uniref:DUF6099 family protein n=1 Tax=Streptomyces sp. AJS327 TaxID=2545265 RepID=UPI0015DE0616|nr:DUF6099 family protein [Streptomyces sp. AJS327]MBA0052032.1 hypothetical protein [Streptomyces sp. AJS327]
MDALRLIEATRHALARCGTASEIVAEAWQTQALAEAIGSHLAISGPPMVRSEALGLSEAGSLASAPAHPRAPGGDAVRAARLTLVVDPRCTLLELGELLVESGVALVAVAASASDEALYWQCIEAIDAADESGDRVTGILRRLESRERGGVA